MKNFIKYVVGKPKVLAWYIGVFIFFILSAGSLIRDFDIFLDNPTWLIITVAILLPTIFIVACYQPYKEWKDGQRK